MKTQLITLYLNCFIYLFSFYLKYAPSKNKRRYQSVNRSTVRQQLTAANVHLDSFATLFVLIINETKWQRPTCCQTVILTVTLFFLFRSANRPVSSRIICA